jgi:hypothetical protein
MKTVNKLYRQNYTGENVVTNMTFTSGAWELSQENVNNLVTNQQISNKAIIIGNGQSRAGFNLDLIRDHKGGLLASGALQSYGCNALYRDFSPHFLVANGREIISEIAASGYCANHIVYSHADAILNHPGKYYLIPQDPGWNAGAIATYMACFDGHKKVFLMGFDGMDTATSGYNLYQNTPGYTGPSYGYNDAFMEQTMAQVFGIYGDVDFVFVAPTDSFRIPESWKYVPNFRQIDFNQFASEADLG